MGIIGRITTHDLYVCIASMTWVAGGFPANEAVLIVPYISTPSQPSYMINYGHFAQKLSWLVGSPKLALTSRGLA